MNESETESVHGRCDFCQTEEAKYTINGGLWWICKKCMDKQYPEVSMALAYDAQRSEEE